MLLRGVSRCRRALLAGLALAGALLLVAAELSPLYTVVVGTLQTPRRSVSAGSNHGYALVLVAAASVAMTVAWLRRADVVVAGPMLGLLGVTALVVALVVDLPDTRAAGRLPESLAYSQARAVAGRGLTLELAGGGALVLCGLGMTVTVRRAVSPTARPSRRDAPQG